MTTDDDGRLPVLELRLAMPGRVAHQPTVAHRPCRNLLEVQAPTVGRPGLRQDGRDSQADQPMAACLAL